MSLCYPGQTSTTGLVARRENSEAGPQSEISTRWVTSRSPLADPGVGLKGPRLHSGRSLTSMKADSSHSWKGFSGVGWGRSLLGLSGTAFGRSERKGTTVTFCGDEEDGAAGPKGFAGSRVGSNRPSLALPEAG